MMTYEILAKTFNEIAGVIHTENTYSNKNGWIYCSHLWSAQANSYAEFRQIMNTVIECVNRLTYTDTIFNFSLEQDNSGFEFLQIIITMHNDEKDMDDIYNFTIQQQNKD